MVSAGSHALEREREVAVHPLTQRPHIPQAEDSAVGSDQPRDDGGGVVREWRRCRRLRWRLLGGTAEGGANARRRHGSQDSRKDSRAKHDLQARRQRSPSGASEPSSANTARQPGSLQLQIGGAGAACSAEEESGRSERRLRCVSTPACVWIGRTRSRCSEFWLKRAMRSLCGRPASSSSALRCPSAYRRDRRRSRWSG